MSHNRLRIRLSLAVLFAVLALGCGQPFHHKTPSGFVELEDQEDKGYNYRAVSADGTVLAVRALENKPKGELAFWADAIRNHMRQQGGYAHLATRDLKTRSGLVGKQLRFGHDRSQKPHLYYVTVFVTDDYIYVLEAGGTKERVEKSEPMIDESIATFTGK